MLFDMRMNMNQEMSDIVISYDNVQRSPPALEEP